MAEEQRRIGLTMVNSKTGYYDILDRGISPRYNNNYK